MWANRELAVQLFYLALLTQLLLELHKHLVDVHHARVPSACKKTLCFATLVACIRLQTITALDRDEAALCWCELQKACFVDESAALVQNLVSPLTTCDAFFSFSEQTISKKGWRRVQWLPFATGTGKLLPPTLGDFFISKKAYVMPKSRSRLCWLSFEKVDGSNRFCVHQGLNTHTYTLTNYVIKFGVLSCNLVSCALQTKFCVLPKNKFCVHQFSEQH